MPLRCYRCQCEFKTADSIGSKFHLCQDCWETECSELLWSAVVSVFPNEYQDLMTEHDIVRLHNPDGLDENPKDRVGAGKPPLHLIPPAAEILEAVVMGLGAKKYGEYNWRSAKIRTTIYIAAAKRQSATTGRTGGMRKAPKRGRWVKVS